MAGIGAKHAMIRRLCRSKHRNDPCFIRATARTLSLLPIIPCILFGALLVVLADTKLSTAFQQRGASKPLAYQVLSSSTRVHALAFPLFAEKWEASWVVQRKRMCDHWAWYMMCETALHKPTASNRLLFTPLTVEEDQSFQYHSFSGWF